LCSSASVFERVMSLRFIPFFYLALLIGGEGAACAQITPEEPLQPDEPPSYVAGRLVVKLTPAAYEQVAEAEGEGEVLEPKQLPIESFRTLSEKYRVIEWRRLIVRPFGNDPSGLNRIYLLTCDAKVDVARAAQEFGALSDFVEYAEPDFIVRTQPVEIQPVEIEPEEPTRGENPSQEAQPFEIQPVE